MRILFLAHNHPLLHPGGTEIFAKRLKQAVEAEAGIDIVFAAAKTGARQTDNAGTHFGAVDPASGDILLSGGHFQRFALSQADTYGVLRDVEQLARHLQPDIVHFHHFLELGLEAITSIRHGWPRAKIVLTLHDYYAICSNHGLLIKTKDGQVCRDPHPVACQRCFPERRVEEFRLRELFVRAAFGMVDRFIAPSRFLREQFLAWGLEPERIVHIPNGYLAPTDRPARRQRDAVRPIRFGFFGNVQPHKGVLVLLEAARRLQRDGAPFELHLHGFDGYTAEAVRTAVRQAVKELHTTVFWHGPYRAEEASQLMASVDWVVVPSIWPENSPLVIQEALAAGCPVICSDLGGMAEHVTPDQNGLRFRMGDPVDLALVMRDAIAKSTARPKSVKPSVPDIGACAKQHLALYRSLIGSSANRRGTARQRRARRSTPIRAAAE